MLVNGSTVIKQLEDIFPDIIKQIGHKQEEYLLNLVDQMGSKLQQQNIINEEDEDEEIEEDNDEQEEEEEPVFTERAQEV